MRRQPIDPARRAEALTLAEQVGAAEAARRLGLKEATIRQWRRRQKVAAPQRHAGAQAGGLQAVELDEVQRLEQLVRAEEGIAVLALSAANDAIRAGKASDGRNHYMVSHGIAVQRAGDLRAQLHTAREHQVRLAEQHAQGIANVIRAYFTALGLEAHGGLLRDLLCQVPAGEPLAASPANAEPARLGLVEALADEIQARRPALEPDWRHRPVPGLSAPGQSSNGDGRPQGPAGGGPMVGPTRKSRAARTGGEAAAQGRTNGSEPPPRQPPMPGDLYADPSRWRT